MHPSIKGITQHFGKFTFQGEAMCWTAGFLGREQLPGNQQRFQEVIASGQENVQDATPCGTTSRLSHTLLFVRIEPTRNNVNHLALDIGNLIFKYIQQSHSVNVMLVHSSLEGIRLPVLSLCRSCYAKLS